MKPGVIGIGVQKCMTSWIHALAGAHPDIVASTPKEVDFFSYYFDRGSRWYEGHFQPKGANAIGFESSPSYFHDPRAPERLAGYRPDTRIVLLLRDPVERAYSNHLHEVVKGHIPPCAFSEGLANNPAYVEQGLYATHVSRWLDWFPRERMLILIAEEIVSDLGAAARRTYDFFGVDPEFQSGVLGEKRNDSDTARFPLLRETLRVGGDALRRAGLEEALIRMKRLPPIKAALNYNSVPARDQVPPLSEEERARMIDLFASETERLAPLLGRDSLPWATWRRSLGQDQAGTAERMAG